MKGKIVRLNSDKGFGFIQPDERLKSLGGKDIFFHRSGLLNTQFSDIYEGQECEFELEDAAKGPRAERITV